MPPQKLTFTFQKGNLRSNIKINVKWVSRIDSGITKISMLEHHKVSNLVIPYLRIRLMILFSVRTDLENPIQPIFSETQVR
jgi:hypothetical protein